MSASLIRTGYPLYCAHFPGGDPRRFEPDPDGATEEEMDRWKAACEAAEERKGLAAIDAAVVWEPSALLHLSMFGPGVYYYPESYFEDDEEEEA